MKNSFIGLCVFLLISGCTTAPSVDFKEGMLPNNIHDRPIVIHVHEESSFHIMTPGGMGLVGALIEKATTPNWQGVVPNAPKLIAMHLREGLSSKHGLLVSPVPDEIIKGPPVVKSSQKEGPYSLSLSTTLNRACYRPLHWQTYQYNIIAYSTLRAPDGEILWQKNCVVGSADQDDKSLQLHMTEFRRDGGKKFTGIVETGIKKCADQLLSEFTY